MIFEAVEVIWIFLAGRVDGHRRYYRGPRRPKKKTKFREKSLQDPWTMTNSDIYLSPHDLSVEEIKQT